jgi:hypothetical protein
VQKHKHSLFMSPKSIKKVLTFIAFSSLGVDVAITVVTLASVQIGIATVQSILIDLNYLLTAVVIITAVLFADYMVAVYKQKIHSLFRHWR